MRIKELIVNHMARCLRWHADSSRDWSIAEWTNAMAGECGEACNASKKLLRHQLGMLNPDARDAAPTEAKYKEEINKELADVIHYAVLTAIALDGGTSLEDALRETFNAKSVQNGFPERL